MSISLPWAIALAVAALTAVLAIVDIRASRAGASIPPIARLTHLCAGGLVGYLIVAFYPAAPAVIAIGGMLAVRAAQASRWTDIGLLATGFGMAWASLFGWSVISQSAFLLQFLVGSGVLVGGLGFLILDAVADRR